MEHAQPDENGKPGDEHTGTSVDPAHHIETDLFSEKGNPFAQDHPPGARAEKNAGNEPEGIGVALVDVDQAKPGKDSDKREHCQRVGQREEKGGDEIGQKGFVRDPDGRHIQAFCKKSSRSQAEEKGPSEEAEPDLLGHEKVRDKGEAKCGNDPIQSIGKSRAQSGEKTRETAKLERFSDTENPNRAHRSGNGKSEDGAFHKKMEVHCRNKISF